MLLGTAWPSDHGVGRWGWRYHGSTTEATGAAGARLTATASMTRLVCNLVPTMTLSLVRRICHRARLGMPATIRSPLFDLISGIFLSTTRVVKRFVRFVSWLACAGVAGGCQPTPFGAWSTRPPESSNRIFAAVSGFPHLESKRAYRTNLALFKTQVLRSID